MKQIDLHIHTNASDGEHSPKEIIDIAISKNMKAIAITDHDTIAGIKSALDYVKSKEIEFVPGIEIGCDEPKLDFLDIHVIGLFINPDEEGLISGLEWLKQQRIIQKKEIIKKLNKLGYEISFEELVKEAGDSFGRPHLAKILLRKYPKKFKSFKQIFDELLGKNGIAYVFQNKYNLQQVIKIIKNAGGIPILAHPGIHFKDYEELINLFIQKGGKGIEIDYDYENINGLNKEDTEKLINNLKEIAINKNLLISGGSDFHGTIRSTQIGDNGINELEYLKLKSNL